MFSIVRWEKLGDIIVLPVTSFKDEIWDSLGDELWSAVAKSLSARRLARQVCYCIYNTKKNKVLFVWGIKLATLRIFYHLNFLGSCGFDWDEG